MEELLCVWAERWDVMNDELHVKRQLQLLCANIHHTVHHVVQRRYWNIHVSFELASLSIQELLIRCQQFDL